jgi:quinol monooxygenase YgiN
MIRHIVFIKFKPGTTDEAIDEIESGLNGLKSKISDIEEFECGLDVIHSERSFDFALISSFKDLDALQRYQVHPEHQAVVAKIKLVAEATKAVDYAF